MLRLINSKSRLTRFGNEISKSSNYLFALNTRKIKKSAMNEQLLQSYAALHAAGLFRQS